MPKYTVNDAAVHRARELIGARRYVLHSGTVTLPVSGRNSLLVDISADGAWTMTRPASRQQQVTTPPLTAIR